MSICITKTQFILATDRVNLGKYITKIGSSRSLTHVLSLASGILNGFFS